jgi:hypothetical protein
MPWELRKLLRDRLRRHLGPRPNGLGGLAENDRKPWPPLPGVPERQRSGYPYGDGRCDENSTEEAGFGGENRPEHLAIADRRKPEPIDHEVTRQPQCYKAGHEEHDRSRHTFPSHLPPPSCVLRVRRDGHCHMNVRCESFATQYVSKNPSVASGAALNMPLHAQKFQRSTSPNEDVTMPNAAKMLRRVGCMIPFRPETSKDSIV